MYVIILKLITEFADYLSMWNLVFVYVLILKLINEFANYLSSWKLVM
jgi:hypothetical protein